MDQRSDQMNQDGIIRSIAYFSNGTIYLSRESALENSDPFEIPEIVPVKIFGMEVRCPLSGEPITIWTDKPTDWSNPIIFEPDIYKMIITDKGRLVRDDNKNYFYLEENNQVGDIATEDEWKRNIKKATVFFVKASAIGVYDAEAEKEEEEYWRQVADEESLADFVELMDYYRVETFWAIMRDPDASVEDRIAARNELILLGEMDSSEDVLAHMESEADYDEGLM